MSVQCKDGAWITTRRVVQLSCTACSPNMVLLTTMHSLNEREEEQLIKEHAVQAHGGVAR
jgi:hypothetical protein